MEARLFDSDGRKVRTTDVGRPPPPYFVIYVDAPRMMRVPSLADASRFANVPMPTLRFRCVGVEVDQSGTWARYEQDELDREEREELTRLRKMAAKQLDGGG